MKKEREAVPAGWEPELEREARALLRRQTAGIDGLEWDRRVLAKALEIRRKALGGMTLYLVGCGQRKACGERFACELYTGSLFRAARRYVQALSVAGTSVRWGILSARFGFLDPLELVEPYEHRLKVRDLPLWVGRLRSQLFLEFCDQVPARVVVLAGALYVEGARRACRALGWQDIETPLDGLGMGQRLHWFSERTKELAGS